MATAVGAIPWTSSKPYFTIKKSEAVATLDEVSREETLATKLKMSVLEVSRKIYECIDALAETYSIDSEEEKKCLDSMSRHITGAIKTQNSFWPVVDYKAFKQEKDVHGILPDAMVSTIPDTVAITEQGSILPITHVVALHYIRI